MITTLICVALLVFQAAFFLSIVTTYFPNEPGTTGAAVRNAANAIVYPVLLPVRQAVPSAMGGMFPVADLIALIVLSVLIRAIC